MTDKFYYAEEPEEQRQGTPWPYGFLLCGLKDEGAAAKARDEVLAWCRDQFGAANPHDRGRWRFMGRTIRFRLDRDATAFKVRWVRRPG